MARMDWLKNMLRRLAGRLRPRCEGRESGGSESLPPPLTAEQEA